MFRRELSSREIGRVVSEVRDSVTPFILARSIKAIDCVPTRILKFLGLHPGEYVVKVDDVFKVVEMAVLKTIELIQESECDRK